MIFSFDPLDGKYWKEGIQLRGRWVQVIEELGGNFDFYSEDLGKTSVTYEFFQLFYRYSEKHRFYHTPKHVLQCLKELESLASPELKLALFFHDVVYDPKAHDNEEQSVQYAQRVMEHLGLKQIGSVSNLILQTKHSEKPRNLEEKLIVDADLSIFGKPEEIFEEYEREIRKEYSFVCDEEFKIGRKKVLEYFLSRDSIYQTEIFKRRYEAQARKNLERSINTQKSI